MAKIILLATLSIDGYLAKREGALQWWLHPEKYEISKIREDASFMVSEETSFECLQKEARKKDDKTCLIEGRPELVDMINKALKCNLIHEMIIYRIPLLAGGGHLLFQSRKAPSHWLLKEKKNYDANVERLVYHNVKV